MERLHLIPYVLGLACLLSTIISEIGIKIIPVHTTKAYRRRSCIAPLILKLGTQIKETAEFGGTIFELNSRYIH